MTGAVTLTRDGTLIWGEVPIDPLIHSARWVQERPHEWIWWMVREHERTTGRRPRAIAVSPAMRQRLLLVRNGPGYAVEYAHPDAKPTIWGIPLEDAWLGGVVLR